jgi:hypothetical protein
MPPRRSVCHRSVGIAALREPGGLQEICLPFGPHAGSHSHLDRLGIQVFPWSGDPGTPLYGIEARSTWYRQSAAHNVVVVDGASQVPCTGGLLDWTTSEASASILLAANRAYPGIQFSRRVTLSGETVRDELDLDSEIEHTYDWLWHVDGVCHFDSLRDSSGKLADSGAYAFITRVAQSDPTTRFSFTVAAEGKAFRVTLSGDAPFKVILAHSPARVDRSAEYRQTVIARIHLRSAKLTMTSELVQ